MIKNIYILLSSFVALTTLSLTAKEAAAPVIQNATGGILGKKAPAISVDKWVSLPEGSKAPTAESLKGKITYLYCFQSWCPSCHTEGIPNLQKVSKHFKDDKDVQFIAVQTVFEGFDTNTQDAAIKLAKKYKLTDMPIGHSGSKEKRSAIMTGFETRGTPWVIIIGKDGLVKYNFFEIKPKATIKMIDQLKVSSVLPKQRKEKAKDTTGKPLTKEAVRAAIAEMRKDGKIKDNRIDFDALVKRLQKNGYKSASSEEMAELFKPQATDKEKEEEEKAETK